MSKNPKSLDRPGAADDPDQLIAIVGMAARLPGAPDTDAFWQLLTERGDAVRPIPGDRWDTSAQLDPERQIQSVGGFLDGVDLFDATFFGISPREAESMDPQQRLMMESAWRTLEDAGRSAAELKGSRTGVYVGVSWHDYEIRRKEHGVGATQHSAVGNALDVVAARVSYYLGLTGPSLAVETGCSSSLVALHLAVQALRGGDIDGALVGGVNLITAPDVSIGLTHFGGLSPTGRCQAFSAQADGFVRGEGVVTVYLKTLSKAVEDGDKIRGVIVRTAVNNDGGGESLVTPNPDGQEDLLRQVYGDGSIPLDRVGYIEAHGTGTYRGDPIEARGIGRVIGQRRDRALGPLGIGSVKTNIGHLEAAAGMGGMAKAILSLEHGVVPPSLHSAELNPEIPFDELNLKVVREPLELPQDGPLYVGVNSFGWGGTNAHVVIGRAPETTAVVRAPDSGLPVLLPLSAQGDEALRARATELADSLPEDADTATLRAIAGTLGHQRDQFPARLAVVGADAAELAAGLRAFAAEPEGEAPGVVTGRAHTQGRTAFVFPGQGSQWSEMGKELYTGSPVFAAVIDRCAKALAPYVDWNVADVVSGAAGEEWLERIDMLQPALWAMSLGLAEVWRAAGVEPDVVIGHSQGEITAATLAGILSYEDGAMVMARRSAIARRTSGRGLMLAVDLSVEQARAALEGFEDQVALAVNNGPSSCVLSGYSDAVLMLREILEADGVYCRLVKVDYASHSPQMDELRDDLMVALADVAPKHGEIALMSTVRTALLDGPEMDCAYWVENLRSPVLFADTLGKLLDDGITHVVEISPHPVLAPAIEQLAELRDEPAKVLSTLRRGHGAPADLTLALARGYVAGLEPFGLLPRAAHAAVPGYPWNRTSHWTAQGRRRQSAGGALEFELAPRPGEEDAWQGELELDLAEYPWLRDHQVHEAVVLPGAAMLSLSLTAARARTGELPRTVEGFVFRDNLTLGQAASGQAASGHDVVRLSALWRDDVTEGGSFTLLSLAVGTTGWTRHATGRLTRRAQQRELPAFPEALLEIEAEQPADFYAACTARGLNYGPAFQGVTALHAEGVQALGALELPARCRAGARPSALHPALLDAALQVSLALVGGDETVVPVAVERVLLHSELAEPVVAGWSHAVRRGATTFDVVLFGAEREPLVTLEGLTLQVLAAEEIDESDTELLHRLRFRAVSRPEASEASEGSEPSAEPVTGSWAVVHAAADGERAKALVAALAEAGTTAAALAVEAAPDETALAASLREHEGLTGLVHLVPAADAGEPAQRAALHTLACLVRATLTLPESPRLTVLTVDAQAAADEDRPDPGAALFWGFTRVLRREHPELRPQLLDVAADWTEWAAETAAELLCGDEEDQLALRPTGRLAGRLTRGAAPGEEHAYPWHSRLQPFRLVAAKPGFWDSLEFRPQSRRTPGPGEVEVQVTASALNFIDVMKAMGTYPDGTAGADLLGGECAGRVVAVGEGVTGVQVDDRVVACVFGSLASHVTVRADHTRPIPDGMADQDAAGLPLVLATAWHGLVDLGRLTEGETVLVHSAAGGLGLAAIAVAKSVGARVIATAGSERKRDYLRSLGVEDVFDSRELTWADEVRAVTGGRGVDVVLNSLTGAAIPLGLMVLAEDGRFIEVGKKDIYADRGIGLGDFRKSLTFASVDLAGLMDRRPERFARLFADVWARVLTGEIKPLPVLVHTFAESAEALREMSHGSHIGKFVLVGPGQVTGIRPEPLPGGRFRADGSYLITGGLGALGLSLAEHLAANGAGGLALLGRRTPDAEAAKRIEALRADGVRVESYSVDVADTAALAAVLDRARAELPPLRGVFHAAGLLDDATVLNVRAEQIERVISPKIDGARNLNKLTEDDDLDLFVLFSSAAALFGNAGQAAYAAGNAYLDSLADARRRRGVAGLSVQWGPFEDIGLAASDANRGARLEERGMGGFGAEDAWRALGQFLEEDERVLGFVPLNLRQWFDAYPDTAALRSWQVLRQAAEQGGGQSAGSEFLAGLLAAPVGSWPESVESKVRELAGRVLRLETTAIDRETPFKALGLDSLMSLELRNRLEAAFGLKLSPTLLWTYGNTKALSGVLCERLAESATADN
ncbi:SDR family NAD(P)-dependent oxidoreductase [Streptacidiphilus sp. MAP5-3]|uniref:SDR family NAD(P)-dependent oxidoreductase n=1 Tax=unclassified Streptacidiphilus TaxID=2643834 RepID=UPI003518180B